MSRVPSKDGKSRLGTLLSPAQREALQWAFLEDTLDKVRRLTEFESYLALTPAGDIKRLAKRLGAGGRVMAQSGGNLGQRMHDIAEKLFLVGHAPVILIGTDVPSLPPSYLQEALNLLEQSDLVFGPAVDGGYYLIGMRNFEGRVFEGISWGSERVLEQTLNICEVHNLSYRLLKYLMDIDRPGDLQALMSQYENNNIDDELIPARTIRLLKSIKI